MVANPQEESFDREFKTFTSPLAMNRVWLAAHAGDTLLLQQLLSRLSSDPLERKSVIEYSGHNKQTPLITACIKGHSACVYALLQHGANVYAQDMEGHTGLHHACIHADYDIVAILLTIQDPALRNREGLSALDVCRRNIDRRRRVMQSAKCLELIELRCRLFEGWIYESVNNLASSALGLRSLQSWVRRYAIAFSIGSPEYVEISFYDVIDGLRTLTPRSTILFRVHDPVLLNTQRKMFNPKPYNFTIAGARKMPGGYIGQPDYFELAAFNQHEYDQWTSFMFAVMHSTSSSPQTESHRASLTTMSSFPRDLYAPTA
ncbi:hypothetical protein THRCLA_09317 [Thraustotheca clavata]|uniref:Uncharacterized protein n=1 Tax=Thraustotheca clavata TaxID=74557 RepID=A0A1V9YXF7_9STRA|nr:hypothetical protein THRCLA_09317 [Thraustotheca clavata]